MSMRPEFATTTRIDIPPAILLQVQTKAQPPPARTRRTQGAPPFSPRHSTAETLSHSARCPQAFQRIYDAVIVLDRAGRIVDANPRAEALFHTPASELKGTPIHRIISGADEGLIGRIQTTLIADRHLVIQAACCRSDHSLFTSEITASILDVEKMRVCLFVRDITVRRRSEEMLRTCYNAIMNADCGIAACDLQGVVVYANPAFAAMVTGNGDDDVQGRSLADLFSDGAVMDDLLAAIGRRAENWSGELSMLGPEGSLVFHVTGSCNLDPDEQMAGMVLSFTDITDRKRAEQEHRAAESQRAIVASLAATCHHIGQPATVVKSTIEILASRLLHADPDTKELLTLAMEAANRIATLLHQFNKEAEYRLVDYLPTSDGREATKMLDLPMDVQDA